MSPSPPQGTPPPHLGLEAENGDNDGHNGGDEHGDEDSICPVRAEGRVDSNVTTGMARDKDSNPPRAPLGTWQWSLS